MRSLCHSRRNNEAKILHMVCKFAPKFAGKSLVLVMIHHINGELSRLGAGWYIIQASTWVYVLFSLENSGDGTERSELCPAAILKMAPLRLGLVLASKPSGKA